MNPQEIDSSIPVAVSRALWMARDNIIVSDVSLSIPQGQRVVILGPNGAGKSSLLKLMGLMMPPSSGHVHIFGHEPWVESQSKIRHVRSRIAWIPQGLQVVGRLSVLNNAVLGCLARVSPLKTLLGWFPEEEIEKARQALQEVGVESLSGRRTDTLSGGERQKVAIARALVQGGDILFADEPTAALDPVASRDMMQLIKRLSQERGLTTVTVLHDIDLAMEFADRIVGMSDGKLVLDLPTSEVRKEQLDRLYHHLSPVEPPPVVKMSATAVLGKGSAVLRLLAGRAPSAEKTPPQKP
ncbi:MAG: ATP-binding cassette domain-containing protein [Burkholderiales bacterium]|jgi:phosphonate transport system ATP-binding protein|nr:ATP-binding cassette domain-containing protein [Burkholderiales bacterium]